VLVLVDVLVAVLAVVVDPGVAVALVIVAFPLPPNARILSTARSAAIIIGALGLVATWPGKNEASTTNKLLMP
jgi:hypothetical protein